MIDLKDRAIGAMQRDRLSNFLKESLEQRNSCFYYSLLMAWQQLNPLKLLPRETENHLLNLDKGGVKPNDVVHAVEEQEETLGLVVSKIITTNKTKTTPEEARRLLNFPDNIPIMKTENDVITADQGSDGIIYWQHEPDKAHYTALSPSERFSGDEIEYGNQGGQVGVDELIHYGYTPTLFFQISKK